jgi:hypothetical protein
MGFGGRSLLPNSARPRRDWDLSSVRSRVEAPEGAIGGVLGLQRTAGNRAVSRAIDHGDYHDVGLLQRQPTTVPEIQGKPGAKLSAREAVHQLELKFFAQDGLYSTMHGALDRFREDMKTTLGWFAGEKKASSKEKAGVDAVQAAAVAAAKDKAKEAVTDGLKALAGLIPKVGGPAATAAGIVAGVLWKEFDKIADYDPVITQVALKKPHQHYIEAVDKTLKQSNRTLQVTLTQSEDEMAAGSVDEVTSLIATVDAAIKQVDTRFYLDLVQGYRAIAPASSVELETPHARWTGEKRGLWGGGTYITPIKSGTVYVEFKASGFAVEDIQFVRTVVPELPSDVLASLGDLDESLTLGSLVGTAKLLMEGTYGGWQMRIVKEATGQIVPADSPSYTEQYLVEVARARGIREKTLKDAAFDGAISVYAKIISSPLKDTKLSA